MVDAAIESLTGDVYAEPSRWRPLSLGTFFGGGMGPVRGKLPPTGAGVCAPRQGWIGAQDGACSIGSGSRHTGSLAISAGTETSTPERSSSDTPFNRRFGVALRPADDREQQGRDRRLPHGGRGPRHRSARHLSESENVTQSFAVALQAPTGDEQNGQGVAAVTPAYEFWANVWQGLVVRGGASMFLPYGHDSFEGTARATRSPAASPRATTTTPHDATPFGDLVLYLAAN